MTTATSDPHHSPALDSASPDINHVNRTKIVTTLGPATLSPERLRQLIQAGAGVFRLNMSHGRAEEQVERIRMIRGVIEEAGAPIALLADLQGPKLRTGPLKAGQPVPLENDAIVTFSARAKESEPGVVAAACAELMSDLEPGTLLLLDDGKIRLQMLEKIEAGVLRCRVAQGGMLEAFKGINVPGVTLPIAALTEKDKADVQAALEGGVDYIALSFVQRRDDIIELKRYVQGLGYACPPIIAKIEKPQAVHVIDDILAEADGLMVARGDLGVELRPEEVPIVQKQLVEKANQAEKPVIIATQMLESMIASLQPSRSDVSDIANAVFDRADALMLSGETSVGEHPIETVAMMGRIIHEAEKSIFASLDHPAEESRIVSPNFYHAIAQTACYASRKANVRALVVYSSSGSMAQRISKQKPVRPIIALTPHQSVYHRMNLLWGVTPVMIPGSDQTDAMLESGEQAIFEKQLLQPGDSVVFCAGNTHMKGAANMLKIYRLGEKPVNGSGS